MLIVLFTLHYTRNVKSFQHSDGEIWQDYPKQNLASLYRVSFFEPLLSFLIVELKRHYDWTTLVPVREKSLIRRLVPGCYCSVWETLPLCGAPSLEPEYCGGSGNSYTAASQQAGPGGEYRTDFVYIARLTKENSDFELLPSSFILSFLSLKGVKEPLRLFVNVSLPLVLMDN